MIINAKHKIIIAAVSDLYPEKGFELDGKDLKWQTETQGQLEEPTEEEGFAIINHITQSA